MTCTDFGGEGTGRKSYFSTDQVPVIGQEYFMAVHAEPTLNDRVIMTGYFYSESTGWRLLSKIDTNQSGKPWYLSGLYSFVEQWTEGNTLEPRDAMYGPSFISGDDLSFKQIIDAKYDYGTPENHEHVSGREARGERRETRGTRHTSWLASSRVVARHLLTLRSLLCSSPTGRLMVTSTRRAMRWA